MFNFRKRKGSIALQTIAALNVDLIEDLSSDSHVSLTVKDKKTGNTTIRNYSVDYLRKMRVNTKREDERFSRKIRVINNSDSFDKNERVVYSTTNKSTGEVFHSENTIEYFKNLGMYPINYSEYYEYSIEKASAN